MFKKFLLAFTALSLCHLAHADWDPVIESDNYVATVSVGGSTIRYQESLRSYGPLSQLASNMYSVPTSMQAGLNGFMQQSAAANGVSFQGGSLTGNVNVQFNPQSGGYLLMTLSGLTYNAYTKFSGKKWGIISFSCTNHVTMANVRVTAQVGSVDGYTPSDKVGMTADLSSSTDCDSNLSWILPVIGDFIINKAEGKIDSGVLNGLKGSLAQLKDKLFFERDQNYLVGLNRLIPADKTITLPSGEVFPIGQYVQNNLLYLLANSQITIQLGKGASVGTVKGLSEPMYNEVKGNVLNISITSPYIAFTANLSEEINVFWKWNPHCGNLICQQP